jgi:hypothetical protein
VFVPYGRNSIGQCCECHNKGYSEYRARRKAEGDKIKAEAVAWWAERGIKPGQTVKRFCASFLFGGTTVHGIAKVGVNGPYVTSKFQDGHLTPEGWTAA